jgi:hypothetical protein
MTNKRRRSLILIVVSIPLLLVVSWAALFQDDYDPKSFQQILWRHDLWKIDKDRALSIMTHAPNPDSLVVGKTRSEISNKFGPLTPMSEVSSYVRSCASQEELSSGNAMMLRHSDWKVTFSGDRAIRLTLVKGC